MHVNHVYDMTVNFEYFAQILDLQLNCYYFKTILFNQNNLIVCYWICGLFQYWICGLLIEIHKTELEYTHTNEMIRDFFNFPSYLLNNNKTVNMKIIYFPKSCYFNWLTLYDCNSNALLEIHQRTCLNQYSRTTLGMSRKQIDKKFWKTESFIKIVCVSDRAIVDCRGNCLKIKFANCLFSIYYLALCVLVQHRFNLKIKNNESNLQVLPWFFRVPLKK